MLRTLTVLSRNVPRSFFLEVPNAKESAIVAHASIIDALRSRDADRTAEACYQHLRTEGDQVVVVMERNGFWNAEPPPSE